MLTAIRQWVIRTMMKAKGETGIVKTLPKKDIVELNTQITAQRLMQNGVNPESLKNADQVENAIMAIERRNETMSIGEARGSGIKSADVFDLKGKKIKDTKNIMGGEELPPGDPDLPPPGSRGGPDDIAAPVQSAEESIKDMIEAENKKAIERLKQKMKKEQARSKRISGTLRRDNQLRGQTEEIGKPKLDEDEYEYYRELLDDEENMIVQGDETREQLEAMVKEAEDEMAYMKRLYDKGALDPPEDMAQGGRAGFANGTKAPSITLGPKEEPMGPRFETNDPGEAAKEIIKRLIRVEGAQIPLTEKGLLSLNIDNLDKQSLGGIIDLLGGELQFGVGRDKEGKGAGFTFRKQFADGGRTGYFLGSANPKGLGLLRQILKYMSKTGQELDKFQGVDFSALDMLRFSNPKRLNKLLEDVRGKVNVKEGIMGTDSVKAMQQADREKRKGITAGVLEFAKDTKARDDAIRRRVAEKAEYTIIPKMKRELMEGMGMSEEVAEKTARGMAEAAQNIRLTDEPPIITKEGLLQLENVLKNLETGGKKKRDLNADGGRIGFKDGMTRRTFLKIFGGLVSLPIIGKVIAPLKLTKGVSKVPIIKTDNVPGKPEWFDALVNKVIIEGDDVTKKFATADRQSIHQKTLDDGSVVRVTEDIDDGAVRVEYESEANTFADTVQLQYKKPLPDEGDPRPTARFDVAESGPVGRSYGPDDFEIDVDEVGGTSIRDLDSDVSKLKEYATGKKLTMKEIVEAKRRRDKALAISEDTNEAQLDAVMRRQGDADDSYYGDPDEFASGGIARMLGE